jgi:hypothetical protein
VVLPPHIAGDYVYVGVSVGVHVHSFITDGRAYMYVCVCVLRVCTFFAACDMDAVWLTYTGICVLVCIYCGTICLFICYMPTFSYVHSFQSACMHA